MKLFSQKSLTLILLIIFCFTSCDESIISEAGFKSNFNLSWTDESSSSSQHSLKIEFDFLPEDFFNPVNQPVNRIQALWYQTINVESLVLQNLRLSATIKLVNVSGEGVSLEMKGYDQNNENTFYVSTGRWLNIVGTRSWTVYNLDLNGLPRSTRTAIVYLKISQPATKGVVYFDDIILTGNSTENHLLNSDIETGNTEPANWYSDILE